MRAKSSSNRITLDLLSMSAIYSCTYQEVTDPRSAPSYPLNSSILYLPFMFSRTAFSTIAPKSTAEVLGIDKGEIDIEGVAIGMASRCSWSFFYFATFTVKEQCLESSVNKKGER
jgi:hypothetical protein